MPKFAANLTMMFTEWSFLDRFNAAADAGFAAVEFLFPYENPPESIAKALSDNGLTPALFNMPPGNWDAGQRGLACLPEQQQAFQQSVKTALHYASMIPVPHLHMMSGLGDRTDPFTLTRYKDALRYASDRTGEAGLNLLIEPLNPRDMPGYLLNDFAAALDIIHELNLPNLKLQYDLYHRQIMHGDVLSSLAAMLPLIGHIQTASVPKRQEPCTGELNDRAVFSHLDAIGYTGFVGCEYRPANGTLAGLGWMKTL